MAEYKVIPQTLDIYPASRIFDNESLFQLDEHLTNWNESNEDSIFVESIPEAQNDDCC